MANLDKTKKNGNNSTGTQQTLEGRRKKIADIEQIGRMTTVCRLISCQLGVQSTGCSCMSTSYSSPHYHT